MKTIWSIILILALIFFCYFKYSRYHAHQLFVDRVKNLHVTPQNTIFAFDLHSTVLEPNKKEITAILWRDIRKLPLGFFFKVVFWDLAFKLANGTFMIKQALDKLEAEYPGETDMINRMAVEIMSAYRLTPEMLALLQKLKKSGYSLYIASSIWEAGFEKLLEKYPELKELFNGAYISAQANNYIHKPQAAYYQGFVNYLKSVHEEPKNILFIDDSYRNIRAAPSNWYAYQFVGQAQFEQALTKIGVR